MNPLMTVLGLSAYLQVRKSTIYKKTCAKQIPYIKVGGQLRFDKVKIDEWLAKSSVVPLG